MKIEDEIKKNIKKLSPQKKKDVLEFIKNLSHQNDSLNKSGFGMLEGMWTDLGIKITKKELSQSRKEIWGNLYK